MAKNKSYFEMQVFALRITGISLREYETIIYKILSKILLLSLCAYPFLAAGDLFKHDFDTVADMLTYEFSIAIGCIKSITILLNREKIAKVLSQLDEDFNLKNFINGDNNNQELMKKCILTTTVQTSFYWINSFLCYLLAVVYTLIVRIKTNDSNKWQFPYGPFTVLNVTYSPNYEISWSYQTMVAGCITIQFSTIDLLQAAVLCHICFHLRILQNNLRRTVENTYKRANLKTSTNWNSLNESLKAQVKYHLAIINITKQVDESFSLLLMLVFLGTLGMLSFLAYKASMIPLGDVRMIRSFAELSVITLQVLMICFWSDVMASEAKEVGYAAYEASFVGTDLRFQKSLILIMRRSQYPIKLTAGFINISLATFTWILRSTYSTFMILRKHNLGDD